ncbi:MAG: thioredoxin-disulfide reductase [Lachnospiraceae bacterium]|jgi:thioredoxin reductase (NADPH)|nr:thioredoxin-disulfide reductase [Lachnospiraceae bacterium]
MGQVYDTVIIGAGPGGLAAGLYAGRAKMSAVIVAKSLPGGQAATTAELENYPGFPKGTTGPALTQAMADHTASFGTGIVQEEVVDVDLGADPKVVKVYGGKEYLARTVILAPGASPKSLHLQGEREFLGKGVSYCATCDGDFFEDLDVAVIGNGDTAVEEAMYLTRFAENVTIIVRRKEGDLRCNKSSAERAFANPKIHWMWDSAPQEIQGDGLVERLIVRNTQTGDLSELKVDGVFFFVGTEPQTGFLQGKVELDQDGYIIANDMMETSVPGVYAVGDARQKFLRQVITAAADGAIAAVAAEKYIAGRE